MEEFYNFFKDYKSEILLTIAFIVTIIVVKFISRKAIRKIGRIREINEVRTRLINKYVSFTYNITIVIVLIIIWGISFRELIPILSSIFAIAGIALFANWSILSNVTSGVILFFSFPYKIGDKIRILDKDIGIDEAYLIEDIKAYHIHLRNSNGELLTYPNSLILQKAIALVETYQQSISEDE